MVIAHINPPWSFCFVVITIIPWIYMGFNLLFYVALDSITHLNSKKGNALRSLYNLSLRT